MSSPAQFQLGASNASEKVSHVEGIGVERGPDISWREAVLVAGGVRVQARPDAHARVVSRA